MDTSLTPDAILQQIRSLRSAGRRDNDSIESYRQAAAVLAAIHDPKALRPTTGLFEPGAAQRLLQNDFVAVSSREKLGGEFMLRHDVRRKALRTLGSRERMLEVLELNREERHGPVQQQLEAYLTRKAKPVAEQTSEELEATLQVLIWFDGILDGLPDIQRVKARLDWREFFAPFETLAGDETFRGRADELDRLRQFVGVKKPETFLGQFRQAVEWVLPSPQPALTVYGPGGVGKSALVARFVLEHTRVPAEMRVPFAYLDFYRPTLSVVEPETLLDEMLRQLEFQFPDLEPEIARIRELLQAAIAQGRTRLESVFNSLLNLVSIRLPMRPYLVILDTFEQVQYRGERHALPLWRLFGALQESAPFLRIVLSGRAPVTDLRLANEVPRPLPVGDLDPESAVAFVMNSGRITSRETAEALVEQVGGVPLSLKLASALLRKQPDADVNVKSRFWLRTADEVIQGQLFERILGQIGDSELKRVAHPGLVLRRVTPEILLKVLREPCRLTISNLTEAGSLFEKLRNEVSLVSSNDPEGALVHRPELREVMLKLLKSRDQALVDDISRRAVEYYKTETGPRARMERTYHELMLKQPIEKTVFDDPEVRASIQASISELPIESQQRLASFGLQVDDAILKKASAEQREASVAEAVEDLLPHGQEGLNEARRRIDEYGRVRHDSPLWRADTRVHFEGGDDLRASEAVENGLRLAIKSRNSFRVLELLTDKAWQCELSRPDSERAELTETLERLSDYVGRHNDAAGRLQHFVQRSRTQSKKPFEDLKEGDGPALGRIFAALRPRDLFGLMPATRGFWKAAADAGIDGRMVASVIQHPESMFASVFFEQGSSLRLLQQVVRLAYGMGGSKGGGEQWHDLAMALEALVEGWPYRNLHVYPPQSHSTAAV